MRKKGNLLKNQIFIFLFLCFFLLQIQLSYSQKGFFMNEKKMYEKYKLSVRYFEKGKEHFHKENYSKAEKELNKCLEIFPQHTQAHFYLATLYLKKENFEKALHHIEKAKENFSLINQMYKLAYEDYVTQLRKQSDEQRNNLEQYKEQLSKTTDSEEKGKITSAISSLENQIETINSRLTKPLPPESQMPADYCYQHGNILFRMKQFQEAQDQWLKTIEADPQHGKAYNNLANLYYMSKQYERALKYLEQAESHGADVNSEFKKAILEALEKK